MCTGTSFSFHMFVCQTYVIHQPLGDKPLQQSSHNADTLHECMCLQCVCMCVHVCVCVCERDLPLLHCSTHSSRFFWHKVWFILPTATTLIHSCSLPSPFPLAAWWGREGKPYSSTTFLCACVLLLIFFFFLQAKMSTCELVHHISDSTQCLMLQC